MMLKPIVGLVMLIAAEPSLASEPLSDRQLDAVTAGQFTATALADAKASGSVISTMTSTLATVTFMPMVIGGMTVPFFQSQSTSTSTSTAN
jgi:hypothetical protein